MSGKRKDNEDQNHDEVLEMYDDVFFADEQSKLIYDHDPYAIFSTSRPRRTSQLVGITNKVDSVKDFHFY